MKSQTALKIIAWISLFGMMFSGYLSYGELFAGVCKLGGGCSTVGSIPACVYGFVMYLIVFIISILGLGDRFK